MVPMDEYLALLATASVVVLPTDIRQYPAGQTVLLEAMAFGVRIVSTDVFGVPEMLVANDEAHLIPAGDPAKLAATLAKALGEHFAGDNRKITAAHTRVLRDFDTTKLLPQHLALCREAALG